MFTIPRPSPMGHAHPPRVQKELSATVIRHYIRRAFRQRRAVALSRKVLPNVVINMVVCYLLPVHPREQPCLPFAWLFPLSTRLRIRLFTQLTSAHDTASGTVPRRLLQKIGLSGHSLLSSPAPLRRISLTRYIGPIRAVLLLLLARSPFSCRKVSTPQLWTTPRSNHREAKDLEPRKRLWSCHSSDGSA